MALPVTKTSFIAAQKEHEGGNFVRSSHPTNRLSLTQLFKHLLLAPGEILGDEAVDERCMNPSRHQRIAPHTTVNKVFGYRIGHRHDRPFTGSICKTIGNRKLSHVDAMLRMTPPVLLIVRRAAREQLATPPTLMRMTRLKSSALVVSAFPT